MTLSKMDCGLQKLPADRSSAEHLFHHRQPMQRPRESKNIPARSTTNERLVVHGSSLRVGRKISLVLRQSKPPVSLQEELLIKLFRRLLLVCPCVGLL